MKRLAVLGILGLLLAGPALAVGYSDGYGRGGTFGDFDPIVAKFNASGERFVIRGRCQSACTIFLSIRNVCIARDARLGFHAARAVTSTAHMMSAYNSRLRAYLERVGAMQGSAFRWIPGREMVARFGYRACS
jgi:hypothetical protein